MNTEDVYLLTPSTMNHHCDAYATNEENMLDWEGNMVQRRFRVQILLSNIPEDVAMTASVQVSSAEARTIDTVLEGNVASRDENAAHPCWQTIPRAADRFEALSQPMRSCSWSACWISSSVSPEYRDVSMDRGSLG